MFTVALEGSIHGEGGLPSPTLYRSIFSQVCKVFDEMSLRTFFFFLSFYYHSVNLAPLLRILRGHIYRTRSRTRVFLSSPSLFVNSTPKHIGLTLNDESEQLKPSYLTSGASTFEKFKFWIKFFIESNGQKKHLTNECIKISS